ncbi:hypothetical protein QTP70_007200 [Hemibagrus guttatus]|uniref:Uncharacterized protein n=1 Tax=Hemibagrus guttatus TaxID=175788 RepID=A0AAE0V0R5_9TELE|nr:hypothetical protein QTP70_007200 [Hemibagrus guttatus]
MEIMATGDEEPQAMMLDSSTDTSTDSSSDDSSSSSTSDSSVEEKKKKKYKKKNGKKRSKKRKKENKKMKRSGGKGERVASISDVVKRYLRVLKLLQKGFRMTAAFKKAHVSRNAVKDTAAIAEIYIADKSVLNQFKALPEGPRGVPRPAERHSFSIVSWVFTGVSFQWGMPGTQLRETSQRHPKKMLEPPQLSSFDVEEKRL